MRFQVGKRGALVLQFAQLALVLELQLSQASFLRELGAVEALVGLPEFADLIR